MSFEPVFREKSNDKYIWDGVLTNDEYKVKGDIKEGDIVLDIGGHIGSFARLCASLGATVFSFEPCLSNRKSFVQNIKGYEDRIFLLPFGIWAGEGVQEHKLIQSPYPGEWSAHTIGLHSDSGQGYESITTIPFDLAMSMFPKGVKLVKVDAEGAEYPIIYKSEILLRSSIYVFEFHTPCTPHEIDFWGAPANYDNADRVFRGRGFTQEWSKHPLCIEGREMVGHWIAKYRRIP